MNKINSHNNQKIKNLIKLQKNKDKKCSFIFIEGFNLILKALNKNMIKEIFLTEKSLFKIKEELKKNNVNKDIINIISSSVSEKITNTINNQEIFAISKINNNQKIDYNKNVLLLDNIQDPGNLGSLLRSALSFDFINIVSSYNTVSYYNQKVLRSTQGNIYDLNLINKNLDETVKLLKENNYLIVGTFLNNDSIDLNDFKFNNQKIALIIGNEGNGISKELEKYIDININISLKNNVDSLNVAIAGSIIMNKFN